jgi:hypothetical protein
VGATVKSFPVGPATGSYTPLSIVNTGTEDYFTASVRNSLTSLSINNPTKVIPLVWEVAEDQPGGSSAKLTFQWNASNAAGAPGFSLSGTHVIGHFTGGSWQQQSTTITGSGPFTTQSAQPYTVFSPFVVAMDSALASTQLSTARGNSVAGRKALISREAAEIALSVYPNPSVSVLNVSHPVAGDGASLRIIGADGRLLHKVAVLRGKAQSVLDVSALDPGYYLLHFEDRGMLLVSRFVR